MRHSLSRRSFSNTTSQAVVVVGLSELGILFVVLLGGCVNNSYEVELTPRGPSVERKLVFERQRTHNGNQAVEAPEPDELPRLAGAYQVAVPERDKRRYEFRGEFRGRIPDDLGNVGSLTHWHTQFGSATVYFERIRGRTDLVADLEGRRAAAEQVCDLISGWLEKELKAEPRFPQLKAFLAGDFRRDVQNVGLYLWMMAAQRPQDDDASEEQTKLQHAMSQYGELLIGLQCYLQERGYITLEQWPELVRAPVGTANGQADAVLALLRRQVSSRMGFANDEPLPQSFGFLTDEKKCEASLNDYLRTTEAFRRLPVNPESPPEPGEVFMEPLGRMIEGLIFTGSDSLKLKLNLPASPLATNGRWKPDDKAVQWFKTIAERNKPEVWPATVFALWCEPDVAMQKKIFGRTLLTDEALLEYCFWRASLTEAEGRQWDEFISRLEPDKMLAEQLKAFRFPNENDEGPKMSDWLRDPILKKLQ